MSDAPPDPFRASFPPPGPGYCGQGPARLTRGLSQVPEPEGDATDDIPREPPQTLLIVDPAWRATCLERVGGIPAGYTYLAQLMGHDMGNSVAVDAHPHAAPSGSAPLRRYNLIENPLCLETIYGAGPLQPGALYDPQTLLFRLQPGVDQAALIAYRPEKEGPVLGDPIRVLHDERNRDTLMLHELAVAWMQFHNRCARRLAGQGAWQAHVLARGHVVRVWHRILVDDLLKRFVHPAISGAGIDPRWVLDETTLLNGLSRAFHALPLDAYPMKESGLHNLCDLMKSGHGKSLAENSWHVDWPLMLGKHAGGPKTGVSASIAGQMRLPLGAIARMDLASATGANPLRLGHPAIAALVNTLPRDWPKRLTPAQLAQDFSEAFPKAPVTPTAADLSWGPLYQALMVEAQIYGHGGGFGPLGSALLKASVLNAIERVRIAPGGDAVGHLETPETMLELITLARST